MDYTFLSKTNLFEGISEAEIQSVMHCLMAHEQTYKKGETIYRAGDVVTEIGLVESGSVNIVVNFYWGNSNIFGHVTAGTIFAENYAAIPNQELLVDIIAAEDCKILFLNMQGMLTTCKNTCSHHQNLIQNLLRIAATNNMNLSSRMMHIAPKSIREKLLSYLSEQANVHANTHFMIPFSRQQLADYLGVDRSALSNELSKMRRDGLIEYRKNEFTLLENAEIY